MIILTALALLTATPANFTNVLTKAVPGDTIVATGQHGDLSFKARNDLTIKDLNAKTITIRGGSKLNFVNTKISLVPTIRHQPLVNVMDGTNITFTNLDIKALPNAAGERNGYGVNLLRSKETTFTNLTVSGATKGMVMVDSSNTVVRNARLTNLRSDGIQFGAMRGLLIEDTVVAQLYPVRVGPVSTHDHADGIQGLSASSDVTIRRFWFMDGADGQGIFLSDAKLPARYTNVTVESAFMRPTHVRCLNIDKAQNVVVRDIVCLPGLSTVKSGIFLNDIINLDVKRTLAKTHTRDKSTVVEEDRTTAE